MINFENREFHKNKIIFPSKIVNFTKTKQYFLQKSQKQNHFSKHRKNQENSKKIKVKKQRIHL